MLNNTISVSLHLYERHFFINKISLLHVARKYLNTITFFNKITPVNKYNEFFTINAHYSIAITEKKHIFI